MAKKSNKSNKFWIQKAIKHKGRMTQYAKSNDLSMSEAIKKAKKSKNRSLRMAAILAERLRAMHK